MVVNRWTYRLESVCLGNGDSNAFHSLDIFRQFFSYARAFSLSHDRPHLMCKLTLALNFHFWCWTNKTVCFSMFLCSKIILLSLMQKISSKLKWVFLSILLISSAFVVVYVPQSSRNLAVDTVKPYFGVSFNGNTTDEAKLLIDRIKDYTNLFVIQSGPILSLIHIWRCRRLLTCRSRWSPYH